MTQTTPEQTDGATRWRLSGSIAHALVALVLAYCLVQLAIGLPRWYAFLQTPCAAPCEDERLTVTQWIYAHRAGISPTIYARVFVLQAVVLAATCFSMALLLIWKRPRDRMAYVAALLLVLLGGTYFSIDELAFPDTPLLNLVADVLNHGGFMLLPLFLYIFPDGRFVPSWTRWAMLATAIAILVLASPAGASLQPLAPVGLSLYALPPIYAQIYRYRYVSGAVQRQQTKWVMYGFVVAVLLFFLFVGADILFDADGRMAPAWKLALEILTTLNMMLIPLTIGISVLRYRLFDIDFLIRRTIQYAIVTALLVLVYGGSVVLLQGLFVGFAGRRSQIAVALSTLAIAALFAPVRQKVQAWVDGAFYRRRYNAQHVLEEFTRTARDETDVSRLAGAMTQVIHETLQPATVAVWLAPGDGDGMAREPGWADRAPTSSSGPAR